MLEHIKVRPLINDLLHSIARGVGMILVQWGERRGEERRRPDECSGNIPASLKITL